MVKRKPSFEFLLTDCTKGTDVTFSLRRDPFTLTVTAEDPRGQTTRVFQQDFADEGARETAYLEQFEKLLDQGEWNDSSNRLVERPVPLRDVFSGKVELIR